MQININCQDTLSVDISESRMKFGIQNKLEALCDYFLARMVAKSNHKKVAK